jgi:hypothetical protein
MTGIIDRVQTAIGSDYAKVAELVHHTFQDRMTNHGHFGRAAVETAAEVCRHHPIAVGLTVGLMVDRLLVEEAHRHGAKIAAAAAGADPAPALPARADHKAKGKAAPPLRLTAMKPGRIALEVFGGLLLLKMAASGAKIFRHKHQSEIWFAPAAKMRLFSSTLCAYNLTKALRSKNVSAWRNGAVFFFGTDAVKPVLKWYRTHPPAARQDPPARPADVTPGPVQPSYGAPPPPGVSPIQLQPLPATALNLHAVNSQ